MSREQVSPKQVSNESIARDAALPVALITGASRGIGKAIAEDLGRTHHILVGGRDEAAVATVVASLPSAEPWITDVRDSAALAASFAAVTNVDVLVHSAGIANEKPFDQISRDEWRDSFEVNVFGVAELTTLALPALRRSKGIVVFVNSGSGLTSYAQGALYTATKFALRTLADCLREDERGNGVRVSSIHPGFVDTDMGRRIRDELGHAYDPMSYVPAETIAAGVRVMVDAPPQAQVEMMSIRPTMGLPAS
jgi:NADP-dependent 3-hydroxy acid dehydrogenase YdfG